MACRDGVLNTVDFDSDMPDPKTNSVSVVILDSTKGIRRLDNALSSPASLEQVQSNHTVLDWILYALSSSEVDQVTYVGSYHIQKVIERYPGLSFRFQANWQREGEIVGLELAHPAKFNDCLIIRASTILVPQALKRLKAAGQNVSVGYYDNGRSPSFVGMVSICAAQVEQAFDIADSISQQDPGCNLDQWLSAMASEGLTLHSVDLDGVAAPVHDTLAVARTVFGGKGRTLEQVRPLIRNGKVLDQVRFRASEWASDSTRRLTEIQRVFADSRVVVRSSAGTEDGLEESLAGRFISVLDVPTSDADKLRASVDSVVASYTLDGRVAHEGDEVLVQPHVGNLSASGVLLTRDLDTGAPYYVLNIDRHSGRSDSVTSGTEVAVDTVYVSRDASLAFLAPDVRACLVLAQELEELTHLDALDIEFGIAQEGTVYLFQVRPIARFTRKFQLADDDLAAELDRVREFLDSHFRPHPTLAGNSTVLGTMPDWNPAEMIGTTPRPLALSLYQLLVGDQAWAAARAIIGYRDVRPEPLILSLAGQPYGDVRASLNSFLPSELDDSVAEKWVSYCIGLLRLNPLLHDKIEFEVAITCLAFDFDAHAQRLRLAGLGETDVRAFREHLLHLTDAVIAGRVAPMESQFAQLKELQCRRQHWINETEGDAPALSRRIYALLADCERSGVVPFAVLARYAFISIALLRSLVTVGIFSRDECKALLQSIPTVASDLTRDLSKHAAGLLSTDAILERYGHLRPSSYDITSPNYAAAIDAYIKIGGRSSAEITYPDLSDATKIFDAHATDIEALMRSIGFNATYRQIRGFILSSIPGREWAKFELMKSVDAALEAIANLGHLLGFSREDMSFLSIDMVARGAKNSANSAVITEFRRAIEFNKKRWNLTSAIRLPHVVSSGADTTTFDLEEWTPNFISDQRVIAEPLILETGLPKTTLGGRIVLIRAADPGYDWIFSHNIAGLITEYGGVASHMAIRASEFGLPAAIGCGQRIFDRVRSARLVELDCTNRKIRALS